MMELTAFGTTAPGLSDSPAATPIISVPPNANTTPSAMVSIGARPCGKKPPLSVIVENPGTFPSTGVPVTRNATASTMKATMVPTLTSANQNSSSPNRRTDTTLSPTTTASAISARTHCGIGTNSDQKCAYSATAVMSATRVVDQFRKYSQPTEYAPRSPRNSRA